MVQARASQNIENHLMMEGTNEDDQCDDDEPVDDELSSYLENADMTLGDDGLAAALGHEPDSVFCNDAQEWAMRNASAVVPIALAIYCLFLLNAPASAGHGRQGCFHIGNKSDT